MIRAKASERKTFLLFALAFALAAALAVIILQETDRAQLGGSFYIVGLAIVGCILLVLAGYVWDRALLQRLHEINERARSSADTVEQESGEPEQDEIQRISRQIEQMAQAVQKVEASYRAIVEDQTDMICRYRSDGTLTFVNNAYATFFGLPRQELIGTRFPGHCMGLSPTSEGRNDGPEQAEFEMAMDTMGGERSVYLWSHRAIKNRDGKVLEFQGVGRDISKRKNAEVALTQAKEKAEAADRAKGEFLAIVSHELRTPINGILGFSRLLQDSSLTRSQREHVDLILRSGQSLENLVSDILDLTRIEAGKIEIEDEAFNLRESVESVVAFFAPKAHVAGLSLDFKMDPEVPLVVHGDASRIRQVLVNLLGNALKFTERGGVQVTLSCVMSEPSPGESRRPVRLFFSVRDTGIGIAKEKLDQLFQPFAQVDTSSKRRRQGVGLGLVISQRLCELMGGGITVDSHLGFGTTFRFTVQSTYDPMELEATSTALSARSV